MNAVFLSPCADYAPETVAPALDALLEQVGLRAQVQPGMRVGIKANLVTGAAPDKAVTTHPALLCHLTRRLREWGAEVVIGDSPGGVYNRLYLDRVYAAAGLQACEAAGAELNHDFSVKTADFPEAAQAKTFEYTGWLDKCDLIINFCKLKSHGMMAMSAAVKNLFGTIPGTKKPEYHYRYPDHSQFADMLIDLNLYWKPCLHLVDGVVAMEGNGPTQGTPKQMGVLLAGKNSFALDRVCAHLLGLTPEQVPTVEQSIKRGLCPEKLGEIAVNCELSTFVAESFELPPEHRDIQFYGDSNTAFGRFLGTWAVRLLAPHPGLGAISCVGCGECARVCPAKAITIENGKANIKRSACIRCFCCQEFCPVGAMVSRPPLLNRLLLGKKR